LAATRVIVDDEPDETLVERCREGDRSAFAVLVGRYHRPIYNAAYRVLGNAEDATSRKGLREGNGIA
jgi:RNA polymerase sigma-70 factor (ECF subfamily)